MTIQVKPNNLYRTGRLISFDNGEILLLRNEIEYKSSTTDTFHELTAFDRIDVLAYQYYKDIVEDASKFWWIIADANRITNPLDLTSLVGKRILIPNILKVLIDV